MQGKTSAFAHRTNEKQTNPHGTNYRFHESGWRSREKHNRSQFSDVTSNPNFW
jgi:hypothetical protein